MATLLGFASTSPGGLGVFDAAMFIGLWQFDKEDLLAGLLLFRLFYYVVPFAVTLAVLGVRGLSLDVREFAPHEQEPAESPRGSLPAGTPLPGAEGRRQTSVVGHQRQTSTVRPLF